MLAYLFSSAASTISVSVALSKTINVDMSSDSQLNIYITASNAIVYVSTLNGFDITAYDKDNNQIGKITSSSPIVQLGVIMGMISVKKTGSQNNFACSVVIVSNLPVGKQCEYVIASNTASRDTTISSSKLKNGKINCIWLASSSKMDTQITANLKGTVDAFIPDQYSPFASVSNSGQIKTTTPNTLLVVKLSDFNSPSITIQSSGTNPSYAELSQSSFESNGIPAVNKAEAPEPTSSPYVPTNPPTSGPTQSTPTKVPTTNPSSPTSQSTPNPTSTNPDGQGGDRPSGNKKGSNAGLIAALVIMTLALVVSICVGIYLALKLRVVIGAEATLI